ncbi:MAG: hypothetical protein IJ458_04845 [Clostridia bacterium]|nr:hypothetical protein [Clostridia bacterium]
MKHQPPFYQCEHCVYYTPYYNICDDRICKLYCGHCEFKNKYIRPSLRDCKDFKLLTESEKVKQKQEQILDYEKYLCDTLHKMEKSIKSFSVYLNKNKDIQILDKCIMEDIKKT